MGKPMNLIDTLAKHARLAPRKNPYWVGPGDYEGTPAG